MGVDKKTRPARCCGTCMHGLACAWAYGAVACQRGWSTADWHARGITSVHHVCPCGVDYEEWPGAEREGDRG